MKSTDFKKGDRVQYSGGLTTENGVVTSTNATFVFVDFAGTGIGKATSPSELKKT